MKIKRIIALLLVLAMMLALASCVQPDDGESGENLDGKIDYKVTVLDPFGAPMSKMVVSIFDGEEQVEMRLTNDDGVAKPKAPLSGDSFTVKISSTDTNKKVAYDESLCVLKDGEEEITVVVYDSVEDLPVMDLWPQNNESGEPVEAPVLNGGGYMVDLAKGENYFVFTASMRGLYTISATSSAETSVEYRGGPHYVQGYNIASSDDSGDVYMSGESLCFKIRGFNVGGDGGSSSLYVIMISSSADAKGVITFGYTDELSMSLQELPWNEYMLPAAPAPYVVPEKGAEGFALTDVDVTSKTLNIVYNNSDKLYHVGSEDGPVLLVRLTSSSKYLPSLKSISETDPFAVYVYDDNGEFVDKIIYQTMLEQYCAAADPDHGVVPLDSHLLEAITNYGNAATHGWFGTSSTIFGEDQANVNPALAVYFACCYYAG
jgi:hypothetical protein